MGKIALVAGSTGLVGGHIVRQLCKHSSYDKIIALCRKQPAADWIDNKKVSIMIIDFDQLEHELTDYKIDEDQYSSLTKREDTNTVIAYLRSIPPVYNQAKKEKKQGD